jgi:hypothetical protein
MTMQDHRSIPLEVLRDFVRSQAELASFHACARESGVGRTTLHTFATRGTETPHARVRRLIAQWYLKKQTEAPDIDVVRPYVAALSLLFSSLAETERETGAALLVEALAGIYGPSEEYPRWLVLLLSER